LEVFAMLGMIIVIFVAVLLVTWVIGWASGDDCDCGLRWIFTCMIYAITVALFVMKTTHGA
jgi:hypothetical protein